MCVICILLIHKDHLSRDLLESEVIKVLDAFILNLLTSNRELEVNRGLVLLHYG